MNESSLPENDRRLHNRVKKNCKLRFGSFWNLANISWKCEGDIIDIGGGGVRFLTGESVKQGTQLILVMGFPGWIADDDEWQPSSKGSDVGTLKVIGEVVRVDPYTSQPGQNEVAVRFSGRIRI